MCSDPDPGEVGEDYLAEIEKEKEADIAAALAAAGLLLDGEVGRHAWGGGW